MIIRVFEFLNHPRYLSLICHKNIYDRARGSNINTHIVIGKILSSQVSCGIGRQGVPVKLLHKLVRFIYSHIIPWEVRAGFTQG